MNLRYVQSKGDAFIRHINDAKPTRWDDNFCCFVTDLSDEQIIEFGVSKLQLVTPPPFDFATQSRSEGDAVLIDGLWHQNWVVADLPPEQVEAIKKQAQDNFEKERASLLSETDWWAVRASEPGGTPMTEAQLAYRAALRTMDDAEGFDPFNPDWPEKP